MGAHVFVDGIFTSELRISDFDAALYDASNADFERLKLLKSIGLISSIEEFPNHTRHHHLVGMWRIFNKLKMQERGFGLPKKFLYSFWTRICFAQAGHSAFGYDSERAVLLAANEDETTRKHLVDLLTPVAQMLKKCAICTNRESCDDADIFDGEARLNLMIDKFRWTELHRWVAAKKLISNENLISLLEKQSKAKSDNGFNINESVNILINSRCYWDSICKKLSRCDYVIRDLNLTGRVGIQIDLDTLVANANAGHADWKLVAALDRYATENLYCRQDIEVTRSLFQRGLAGLIINGKVSLDSLFGLAGTALSDDALEGICSKYNFGKEIFVKQNRKRWISWPIHAEVSGPQIKVEKEISGQDKTFLSSQWRQRVLLTKLHARNTLAIAVRYVDKSEAPDLKVVAKALRKLVQEKYPKIVGDDVIHALWGILIPTKIDIGLKNAIEKLSGFVSNSKTLMPFALKAATTVKKYFDGREEGSIKINISGTNYGYDDLDSHSFSIAAMHAKISGGDIDFITTQEAVQILLAEIFLWQSIYFGSYRRKSLDTFMRSIQEELAVEADRKTAKGDICLELYTLIESLFYEEGVSFRISIPSLKLKRDDGTDINEYDTATIVLKDDKTVELAIWGVTTATAIDEKRAADLVKIEALRDLIADRWGALRIATNYVRLSKGVIKLDIDGVKTERKIAVSS